MARYNRWINERLDDCCEKLSDQERKLDRGAFFCSVHGTLNHVLLGDRLWLSRFLSREFCASSLTDKLYSDSAELRGERAKTDAEILEWVEREAVRPFPICRRRARRSAPAASCASPSRA
jgi:uncharacterized damage-inducible protein DinB